MERREREEREREARPTRRAPPGAFEILKGPERTFEGPFSLVCIRVVGTYEPWIRYRAHDDVALELERLGHDREGPPIGIYHDLPRSARDSSEWTADLGYEIRGPADLDLTAPVKHRRVPGGEAVALRYAGDLASFPGALTYLLTWAEERGIKPKGPLFERFRLSDPLTLREERDIAVWLKPTPPSP